MKSLKGIEKIEKEYTPEEIAESFVFPGPKDPKAREALLEEFRGTSLLADPSGILRTGRRSK
jgi:hypothetical protein